MATALETGIDWGTKLASNTITYYFVPASTAFATHWDDVGDVATHSWDTPGNNQEGKEAVERVFDVYESYLNVEFVEVFSPDAANFRLALVDNSEMPKDAGRMAPPGEAGAGTALFNIQDAAWTASAFNPGGHGFHTILHEIGHGLGLAHPHDEGGSSTIFRGVTAKTGDLGDFNLNQGIHTMMSYNEGWQTAPHGVTGSNDFGREAGPMAIDIAVLQAKYGANTSSDGGNGYALPFQNGAFTGYSSIWDAGGLDSIYLNGPGNAVFDLRPATLQVAEGGGGYVSYVQGIHGGFTIAAGVMIEGAIGGEGHDSFRGNDGNNTLIGNGGQDTFFVTPGADTIQGGLGYDVVDFSTLTNFGVFAHLDLLQGETPQFIGFGAHLAMTGIEAVRGTDGADTFFAWDGRQDLFGGAGNDSLSGAAGDDLLNGEEGHDQLDGGLGDDMYLLASTSAPPPGQAGATPFIYDHVIEAADGGIDTVMVARAMKSGFLDFTSYTLGANIENGTIIRNGDFDLIGNELDNTLMGNAGVNLLDGRGSADTLDGGLGLDTLRGGEGGDTYELADTNFYSWDAESFDWVYDFVEEAPDAGIDTVNLYAAPNRSSYWLPVNVENATAHTTINFELYGNELANVLTGGTGHDTLNGFGGADRLAGGLGNDGYQVDNAADVVVERAGEGVDGVVASVSYRLGANVEDLIVRTLAPATGTGNALDNRIWGGTVDNRLFGLGGNDTLSGDGGNDRLDGGRGDDSLTGGAGNDLLTGGLEADTFMFSWALNATTNTDRIVDFTPGQDRIGLEDTFFGAIGPTLEVEELAIGGRATTADQHIVYNPVSGALFYDADGAGGAMQVRFAIFSADTRPASLDAADFVIV